MTKKLVLLSLIMITLIFISCEQAPSDDEADLIDSIPELDMSLVSSSEAVASSIAGPSMTLSLPTADDATNFIWAVMDAKMYADALNEIAKWIKTDKNKFNENEKNVLEQEVQLDIPGMGTVTFYVSTLTYDLTANEAKIYLFFPEPGDGSNAADSNPLRIYIWNRKNPDGGFICDFTWASYADSSAYPYQFDPPADYVNGDSRNDYQSTYFFRVNTKTNKAFYYTKGTDGSSATTEYAGYGELTLSDSVNKFGNLCDASLDENYPTDSTLYTNLLYSDSTGYYIHLDQELSGYEDESDPNVGDFYISKSLEYDGSEPSEWLAGFVSLRDNWAADNDVENKILGYSPADYIPAFNDPMFQLIWPDYWVDIFTPAN